MKKLSIIVALFSFLSGVVSAADISEPANSSKWMGSVEFDPAVISFNGSSTSAAFDIRLTATRKVAQYFSVGGGLGLSENWSFSGAPSLDIFARLHAEDFEKKFSPFGELDMGFDQSFENTDFHAFMFNPTIGIRYGRFSFGIGYRGLTNGSGVSSAINLKLSYAFGYGLHKNEKLLEFLRTINWGVGIGCFFPGSNGKSSSSDLVSYSLSPGLGVELTGMYPINKQWSAGLLLGLTHGRYEEKYKTSEPLKQSNTGVMVAARGRYDFTKLNLWRKLHPYAKFDLGISIQHGLNDIIPVYYSPGVGLSLPVMNDRHSVDLGVSYMPVRMHKNKKQLDSGGCHDVPAANITLGYVF